MKGSFTERITRTDAFSPANQSKEYLFSFGLVFIFFCFISEIFDLARILELNCPIILFAKSADGFFTLDRK